MIGLPDLLFVAAVLFCIGLYGLLTRRGIIPILMCVELMLNAVNINLISTHMKSYVHKSGRCLYCNLCVEVCPVNTLVWDKEYAISTWSKETMTHDAMTDKDRADLEEFLAQVEVEAAEEKAKKEAAAKAKAEAAAKAKAEAENPETAKPAVEKPAAPADAAEKMAAEKAAAAKAAAAKAAAAKSQATEKSAEVKAASPVETKDAEQEGGKA